MTPCYAAIYSSILKCKLTIKTVFLLFTKPYFSYMQEQLWIIIFINGLATTVVLFDEIYSFPM